LLAAAAAVLQALVEDRPAREAAPEVAHRVELQDLPIVAAAVVEVHVALMRQVETVDPVLLLSVTWFRLLRLMPMMDQLHLQRLHKESIVVLLPH
jgi:hypothetical protein